MAFYAHQFCAVLRELATRLVKLHVELDRSMRVRETGFSTSHLKLIDHAIAP